MDVQQPFTNLRKEAECPLCLETVNNPKTLPCLHSFCLACLDKLTGFAKKQQQTTIKCPVCQTSFQIPEGDSFKNLPDSFHLNRLVDLLVLKDGNPQAQKCGSCDENNTDNIASSYCFVCQVCLCIACFEAHQRLKIRKDHRSIVIEKLQSQDVQEFIHRPVMCSQQYHENQPLEFYCQECEVPICLKCSIVSHNRHTMTDTQKAAQVQKMQMKDALDKVKAETVIYDNEIRKQIERLMEKSRNEVMSAEKKMTDFVDECIRQLREHEKTMKEKFAEIHEAQQKHHATRLENLLTQLKSYVERGESIVERNISAEILQTKEAIIRRCEELLNASKSEIYKPPSHVHYVVEQNAKILDRIVVNDTDPQLSLVEGQKEIRENAETISNIVTRNSDGLQCHHADDEVKVKIFTPAGDQLKSEIKDTRDGKYTVTYTPKCFGQHKVEIQVNGQLLTGSPWVVQVIRTPQFAFQFGSKGKEQGQFNSPMNIIVNDKTGRVAVLDAGNERSQIFDFEGNVLNEKRSLYVATASDDEFFFFKKENDKTFILCSEDGQRIRSIAVKHLKAFGYAAFEGDGRIIACDTNDKFIKVLIPDGKDLLLFFSGPGSIEPGCVVHHQDKYFVSYPNANRVMVFNNAGFYLYDIGRKGGSGDGQFKVPLGMVIDKFDLLIVCDAGNNRLQLFTLKGKFVSKIVGRFFNSFFFGCAVSNNGLLFVTDCDRNCVHVFN